MPLEKALRRALRKVLFWEEEAVNILAEGRSLTELPAIGVSLERILRRWIENPPEIPTPPEIRRNFLPLTEARWILAAKFSLRANGDLQMHTRWSDGSGSIEDMARAAAGRGYSYIAVTDHSKGLKIAGGINEAQLQQQEIEIEHGIAQKSGCRISLGTDAHDPSQLRFMQYALASAVMAGIKPDRIVNFLSADELRSWVATVRDLQS
jgi:hypothetical protein